MGLNRLWDVYRSFWALIREYVVSMVAVDFERIREFSLRLVLKRLLNIALMGFHL